MSELRCPPAELPIWRYHPSPDECEHGVTITGHAAMWSYDAHGDVDIVATTATPLTLCLYCHEITPAQEDPKP